MMIDDDDDDDDKARVVRVKSVTKQTQTMMTCAVKSVHCMGWLVVPFHTQ